MFSAKGLAIFFVLVLSMSVFADGMIVNPDMMPVRQDRQEAFIVHENGIQSMVLMVNLQEAINTTESHVWIFPVPAKPEDISIANLKGFPAMTGKDVKTQLTDNLFFLEAYMTTAAFPPFVIFPLLMIATPMNSYSNGMPMADLRTTQDSYGVDIYQHIDKYGLATEVIKADDVVRFESYLNARGTNLSDEAESFLTEYMGKDYSFVVSWISDPEEAREVTGNNDYYYRQTNPIGVFVRFPSENVFFPLKPTAYYGTDSFPVIVNVKGFFNPEIYQNVKESTTISHHQVDFWRRTISEEESLRQVFGENIPSSLLFTRIQINSQAQYFTEDLSFTRSEAWSPHIMNFFNQTWIFWFVVLFALSGLVSASLTKRVLKLNWTHLDVVELSVANFFSIIGAGIVMAVIPKNRFNVEEKSSFEKRLLSLAVFEGFFLVATVILFLVTLLMLAVK